MEMIKLNDGNSMPNIVYGSSIIGYDSNNNFKFCLQVLKKILLFKFKTLKKDFAICKIMKQMKKEEISAIDTSRAYGASESIIGKQLKHNRGKFFIITKISNKDQYQGNIEEAVKDSLKKLNTDYIDLLLLHWPVTDKFIDTYKQMEEMKKKGLCKSIGVCNCNIHHLQKIEQECSIIPSVNEIECHPLFTQNELREYCKKHSIQILAYTATARVDSRLNNTCLTSIAKKYHKTLVQIILRWHIQIGNIPIFNTTNLKRFLSNMNIFDFELNDKEIQDISAININSRLRYDPDNCDFTKL